MRERVVLITPYPPPADGIGSHSRNIANELARTHDVHILAPGERRGSAPETERTEHGGTVSVIRCLRDREATAAAFERIRPRWVYCQFAISAFHVATIDAVRALSEAKRHGARVVVGYHEPSREVPALPVLAAMLYRKVGSIGDAAVAFSPVAEDALNELGIVNVTRIPHGVRSFQADAATVAAVRERHGGKFVLALGFIHPDKGLDTLIEAAGMTGGADADVRYVIAGSPRARQGIFKLNGRADRKHLEHLRESASRSTAEIQFVPYVAEEELAAYIQAAQVSVLPYRDGAQSGIASLTIAAGRGAIVSDLPGMRAQFGDAARYFSAGNAAGLAKEITAVLEGGTDGIDAAAASRRAQETYLAVAQAITAVGEGAA